MRKVRQWKAAIRRWSARERTAASQSVSENPLSAYLADITHACEAGMHYSALALALAIPDICGSIEFPGVESWQALYRLVQRLGENAYRGGCRLPCSALRLST